MKFHFNLCTYTLLLTLLIVMTACGNSYNEEFITSEKTLKQAKIIAAEFERSDLQSLSIIGDDIFVINNLVINLKNKTFGFAPEGGFYESYFEAAGENTYNDLSSIKEFLVPNSKTSEFKVLNLLATMKKIGLTDLHHLKAEQVIMLQWGSSIMHGFNGLIFADSPNIVSELQAYKFSELKLLDKNTFYFSVR